jgi:hypothetical protein
MHNNDFYDKLSSDHTANKPSLPLENLLVIKFVVWYRCKATEPSPGSTPAMKPEPFWADDLVENLINMHHAQDKFLDYPVRLITSLLFDFYSEEGPASEVWLKEDSDADNMGLLDGKTPPRARKEGYAAALMYHVHHHYAYPLMHALARKVEAIDELGDAQRNALWAWLKYVAKRMMNKHWYQGVKTNDPGEDKKLESALQRFYRVSYAPDLLIKGKVTTHTDPPKGIDMGALLSINPPPPATGKLQWKPGYALSPFGFVLVMTLSNAMLRRSFCMERVTGNHPLSAFLEHVVNGESSRDLRAVEMLDTIARDYAHINEKLGDDIDADDNIYRWLNVGDRINNLTGDLGGQAFNNKDAALFSVGERANLREGVLYEDVMHRLFCVDDNWSQWEDSDLDIVVLTSMGFVVPWHRVALAMGEVPSRTVGKTKKETGHPGEAFDWLFKKLKKAIKNGNLDRQTRPPRDLLGGLFDVLGTEVSRSHLDDYAAGFLLLGITETDTVPDTISSSIMSSNGSLMVSSVMKDTVHRVDVPTLVTPNFDLHSNDTTYAQRAYVTRGAANRGRAVGASASILGVGAGVGIGVGGLGTGVGLGVTACGDGRPRIHCVSRLMDELASNDPARINKAMVVLAGMLSDRSLDEAWASKTAKEQSEVRRKARVLGNNQAFERALDSDFFMRETWYAIKHKMDMPKR